LPNSLRKQFGDLSNVTLLPSPPGIAAPNNSTADLPRKWKIGASTAFHSPGPLSPRDTNSWCGVDKTILRPEARSGHTEAILLRSLSNSTASRRPCVARAPRPPGGRARACGLLRPVWGSRVQTATHALATCSTPVSAQNSTFRLTATTAKCIE